jgi:Rieske Fe-S protein
MDSDSMPRRVLLAGAAGGVAAALAGCQVYGGSDGRAGGDGGGPPPGGEPGGGAGATLARTGDIPVGGGKIFTDRGVVVTQPEQGTIKAFSATCTHAGCTVTSVSGGTVNCDCHGSRFAVADGSVTQGPANNALPPVEVAVDGDAIKLA